MIKSYFLLVLKSIVRRRLRSWLTVLGILIGIAAVVALISVSQGLEDAIVSQFQSMGTDKVLIMPGGGGEISSFYGAFSQRQLTREDLETVKKSRGVEIAGGMYYKTAKVEFKDQVKYTFVIGIPTDETEKIFEEVQTFKAEKGRVVTQGDKYDTNVGWLIWSKDNEFFDKKVNLGDRIFIEDIEFGVVGLVKRIGNRADDTQIYVPMETAWEIFKIKDEYSMLMVQVKGGFTPEQVAENIKKDLRKSRGEEEGEEGFSIQTFEQLIQQVSSILNIVGVVLIAIAAISLLVGGIGIMNTMYTSVLERTREIGIMKAIGAKRRDIMTIFLVESGIYGLIGGVIGLLIGIGISKVAEFAATTYLGTSYLKASLPLWLIAGSLLFSFLIGCISGAAPAYQASKLRPVEALRYE